MAGIASHRPTSVVTSAVVMPWANSAGLGETVECGDHLERLHHAVHRAQQAEHGADRADQREVAEPCSSLMFSSSPTSCMASIACG